MGMTNRRRGRRRWRAPDWKEKQDFRRKKLLICKCIQSSPVDIETLTSIAFSRGGFATNDDRKRIWPKLLGLDRFRIARAQDFVKSNETYDDQVNRDIDRSLWNYDVVQDITPAKRIELRNSLFQMINAMLARNPSIHYYQGYHDICSVFLLVVGKSEAFALLEQVSLTYFREAMHPGFESVMNMTKLLFPLIKTVDITLYNFLKTSEVEPYVILPWVITWFSHQVVNFQALCRLFDVFLVSHPLFVLYVSAALVIRNRKKLLSLDCEFGTVHNAIASLSNEFDIESTIRDARKLFKSTPPTELQRHYNSTTRSSMYFTYPFEYQLAEQEPDSVLFDAISGLRKRKENKKKHHFVKKRLDEKSNVVTASVTTTTIVLCLILSAAWWSLH